MSFTFGDWQSGVAPPKGWDCADAIETGWSTAEIIAFMRGVMTDWKPRGEERPAIEDPAPPPSAPPLPAAPAMKTTQQEKPAEVVDLKTKTRLVPGEEWKRQLLYNDEGAPKPKSVENWRLYLTHHPEMAGVLGFNEFADAVVLLARPPWEAGEGRFEVRTVRDSDAARAAMWLERRGLSPSPTTIWPALVAAAEAQRFDPLRDYLGRLRWDGKPRIRTWARDYLGALGNSEYADIVGRRFLISAVARALRPGCKVDTMIVLEGPQGKLKSTAIASLFGRQFFTDQISDVESKDASVEMQGVWAIEIAEMHRFSNAQANAVKKFLSRQEDRYRPPYGRSLVTAPRRCVFVGTINPDGSGYLQDPTGARRFWPLTIVGEIDIAGIERDRDQLWAEAIVQLENNEPWWIQTDELDLIEEEQAARTHTDAWVDVLGRNFGRMDRVSMEEVRVALDIPHERFSAASQTRVGKAMRLLGFGSHRTMIDGLRETIYIRGKA
jgi:predicted P-loop ATPase